MSARPAIVCRGLSVRFSRTWAVLDASFDVPAGSICGLIGPNGAGKTTTLRVLSTTLTPLSGAVEVLGHDVAMDPFAIRRRIGWMPEATSLYPELTVAEYLEFFGRFYGLDLRQSRERVRACLELIRLEGLGGRTMKGFSRGERQRVSLARSLIHNPDLLLLDEPAEGLDPSGRVELRDLLRLLQERGKTIFISSHVLSELEEICTDLVFMREGRVVAAGPLQSFRAGGEGRRVYRVGHLEAREAFAAALAGIQGARVHEAGDGWTDVEVSGDGARRAGVLAALVRSGIHVTEFSPRRAALEEEFLRLLGESPR